MRLLASWRSALLMLLVVNGVLLAVTAGKRLKGRRVLIDVGAYAMFNLPLGMGVSDRLTHRFGTAGAATVTGKHQTATQYNNHNVSRYDVLVRTAEGNVVRSSFEDDYLNVYPL